MTSLNPVELRNALQSRGIEWFTGVPCSYFGGLLQCLENDRYIPAANEGAALASACGLALAGSAAVVLIQNSGLGNLINPLTSLSAVYGIGVLMFVSHRGDPCGPADEPQHRIMGQATEPLLSALQVARWRLPRSLTEAHTVLDAAVAEVNAGRPAAIIVRKGTIAASTQQGEGGSAKPTPADVFRTLASLLTDELVVSTTGFTSRRLFAERDRPGNFYMQGSMGHAASIGLGVALARPGSRVVVLDGDGACLMHLGVLGSIGRLGPVNFLHVVLDNEQYESTGGQPVTLVRYDDMALAAAYRTAVRVTDLAELTSAFGRLLAEQGPALLVVEVGVDGSAPPRATSTLSAADIRTRFSNQARRLAEGTHS